MAFSDWSGRLGAIGASANEVSAISGAYQASAAPVQDALDVLVGEISNGELLVMLGNWRASPGPFQLGFPGGGLPFGTGVAVLTGQAADDAYAVGAGTGQRVGLAAAVVTGPPGISATWRGVWAGGTTYTAGPPPDGVLGSNGHWYVSLTSGNIGHDPTTDGGVHWADTLPPSVVSVSPGSRYDIRSELNFHVPPTIDGLITSYTPSRGRARNALAPLTVPSYDGSGQNVEPSVVHVPAGFTDANGSVWFYLMAVSGYFQGNANFENPQIRGSVDGQTWSTITGAADPLVAQPSSGHNFDQSIALGPDGKIYITFFQSGTGDGLDHLYYISSSDLVDWGGGAGNAAALTQVWQTTTSALRYNTANTQWDGTQWHMWAVRFVGGNALLHWTASTLLGLAGATPVTGTITIPAGRNLWETNIIRIGGLWVGLITTSTDTSGSGSYLHLMTSPDGNTWALGQAPVLKPMFTGSQIGGATPWDAGSVYRAGLAAINTGRGGPRLAVWYSANDGAGTPTWKVGYTEIWFADDFAPRDARAGGNVGGQWYGGALSGVKAATTLTLNRLYLAPAYSGEDGLIVQRLGAQIQTSISTAVLRMGIYLINDQLHPFRWAAGTAWATLLSEATGTIDCSQTPAMYSSLLPTTPSNFVYIPPRTWFAVGGAGQTAAPKLDTGNGVLGLTTPLGNVTSPYSNSANNALYMDGQTGALPQSFVPTGIVGNDAGVGYQLASAANQPNYT